MQKKVALEESSIFAGLTPGVLARIRSFCREQTFEPGTTIFREGESSEHLYVLGSGTVELSCLLPGSTTTTIRITRIAPGDVFGWSALALGEKLTADARAVSESVAYLVPGSRLTEVFDEDPRAGYHVMKCLTQVIARRLRDTRSELRWMHSAV